MLEISLQPRPAGEGSDEKFSLFLQLHHNSLCCSGPLKVLVIAPPETIGVGPYKIPSTTFS